MCTNERLNQKQDHTSKWAALSTIQLFQKQGEKGAVRKTYIGSKDYFVNQPHTQKIDVHNTINSQIQSNGVQYVQRMTRCSVWLGKNMYCQPPVVTITKNSWIAGVSNVHKECKHIERRGKSVLHYKHHCSAGEIALALFKKLCIYRNCVSSIIYGRLWSMKCSIL